MKYFFLLDLRLDPAHSFRWIMNANQKEFIKRVVIFLSLLKERGVVSSAQLGQECGCHPKTALNTINKFLTEYEPPIVLDESTHGYRLTDVSYEFTLPPVDQSELHVLLLLRSIAEGLNAPQLVSELEGLWCKLAGSRKRLKNEAHQLVGRFSCDTTEASIVQDSYLLDLVLAAKEGQCLRLLYASPWKDKEEREYLVQVQKVRLKDGALYLLVHTQEGKERVLNAAYITELTVEPNPPNFKPLSKHDGDHADHFETSFGIWAGEEVHEVVITFAREVSLYYAGQRWHDLQRDEEKDGILTRTLPSILSPELNRRLLSIAPHITDIQPQSLKEELVEIMRRQVERFRGG